MTQNCMLAVAISSALAVTPSLADAQELEDHNPKILEAVTWLASHKAGLGYDDQARFTENLKYGNQVFPAKRAPKTMCVAAVFEVIVRSLKDATDENGAPVSEMLLPGRTLFGGSALHIAPYVFQYKSNVALPEYKRLYSAGTGDAFVLFGIGRYVTMETAKPGDFIYFNRETKGGHAVVFISHLGANGKPGETPSKNSGFRYFSAQKGGTSGMGYRDAYFGQCPSAPTTYQKDCKVIKSNDRKMFSVSRLYSPENWFTAYSAIRVQRFFKGETIDAIFADEHKFRKRAKDELLAANKRAREYAAKGLFPLVVPPIASESTVAKESLEVVEFDDEVYGRKFGEE